MGTGNIIGVSTAICLGGFGAVFWMWVLALLGGATAFIESTLAQLYKRRGPDGWYGGPAYYIETALQSRMLAVLFSVCLILTYGFGFNMLASYNLQSTFVSYGFYDPVWSPWCIGAVLALVNIPAIVILGRYALAALANYEEKIRNGRETDFHSKEICLPHEVDGWK